VRHNKIDKQQVVVQTSNRLLLLDEVDLSLSNSIDEWCHSGPDGLEQQWCLDQEALAKRLGIMRLHNLDDRDRNIHLSLELA
jgi:hypothetical protein